MKLQETKQDRADRGSVDKKTNNKAPRNKQVKQKPMGNNAMAAKLAAAFKK